MSLLQVGTGAFNSFLILAFFRFCHGAVSSSINPLAFSLVADYFPPEKRTLANSILGGANFVGIALSSMTILLIKQVGWRASYIAMGGMGLIAGSLMMLLKHPVRGQFDMTMTKSNIQKVTPETLKEKKKKEQSKKPAGIKEVIGAMKEMCKNPICANIFIAGFLRTMGSTIVTAYTPVFFGRVFPSFKQTYAFLNAIALITCGFSSSILGGIVSDKFEKSNYMTKSWIIMAGNVLSIPLVAFGCLTSNFYLAMLAFTAKIFVSGSYYAPAITMMQNSTRPSNAGLVVSAYTFAATIAQTISPLLFTALAKYLKAPANPRIYGYMVLLAISFGYLSSNFFYHRAGKQYKKLMEWKDNLSDSCEFDPEQMDAEVIVKI